MQPQSSTPIPGDQTVVLSGAVGPSEQTAGISQGGPQPQGQIFDLEVSSPATSLPSLCGQSAHPFTAMMHVLFKVGIIFLYLMLPLLTPLDNYLAIMIMAGAVDFYFVKNIVGRKLVGMRWWFEINDEGIQTVRFETKVDERSIPQASQRVFWFAFYLFGIIWLVLAVLTLFAFYAPHLFLTLYNFALLRYNYYYFERCHSTRGAHVTTLINAYPDRIHHYYRGSMITGVYAHQLDK